MRRNVHKTCAAFVAEFKALTKIYLLGCFGVESVRPEGPYRRGGGLRHRCKLHQWRPGRSRGRNWFRYVFDPVEAIFRTWVLSKVRHSLETLLVQFTCNIHWYCAASCSSSNLQVETRNINNANVHLGCSGQFGTFSDSCRIFAWNFGVVQTPKTRR